MVYLADLNLEVIYFLQLCQFFVNSQITTISCKPIHFINKLKLILIPRVRNSTTLLTLVQTQWQRRNLFANYLILQWLPRGLLFTFLQHPFPSQIRVVGAGVGGGDFPPPPSPLFGKSVNPISTREVDYAQQITTCPPDFQTFLRPCKWTQEHESSIWLYQVISFFLVCSWENRFPWEWWITFAAKLILYQRIFGTWQVQFLVNQAI